MKNSIVFGNTLFILSINEVSADIKIGDIVKKDSKPTKYCQFLNFYLVLLVLITLCSNAKAQYYFEINPYAAVAGYPPKFVPGTMGYAAGDSDNTTLPIVYGSPEVVEVSECLNAQLYRGLKDQNGNVFVEFKGFKSVDPEKEKLCKKPKLLYFTHYLVKGQELHGVRGSIAIDSFKKLNFDDSRLPPSLSEGEVINPDRPFKISVKPNTEGIYNFMCNSDTPVTLAPLSTVELNFLEKEIQTGKYQIKIHQESQLLIGFILKNLTTGEYLVHVNERFDIPNPLAGMYLGKPNSLEKIKLSKLEFLLDGGSTFVESVKGDIWNIPSEQKVKEGRKITWNGNIETFLYRRQNPKIYTVAEKLGFKREIFNYHVDHIVSTCSPYLGFAP